MATPIRWQIKLFGFEVVEVYVEIDVDHASLFPMTDGDGNAGVGQRDGGIIVGTNERLSLAVSRRTAFAFRLWFNLHRFGFRIGFS